MFYTVKHAIKHYILYIIHIYIYIFFQLSFRRPVSVPVLEAQDGIKVARRNIKNLRYTDDTTLMAESEEELKSLLMKVKYKSEKLA